MREVILCVFRLPNEAEYMFIAENDAEVQSWVSSIKMAIKATQHVTGGCGHCHTSAVS